jgi:hypothetical protein
MQIPVQTEVKYLDLCHDQKLAWQKHVKTYNLPAGYHQQYANTGSHRSKMLGLILRPQTDMVETRQNKASQVKLRTTRNVLAFGP